MASEEHRKVLVVQPEPTYQELLAQVKRLEALQRNGYIRFHYGIRKGKKKKQQTKGRRKRKQTKLQSKWTVVSGGLPSLGKRR